MNGMEEVIRDMKMNIVPFDELEEILKTVNDALASQKEALDIIEKAGKNKWSYEVYVESLSVSSDYRAEPIDHQTWGKLSPKDKKEARIDQINTIVEIQQRYELIKIEVEAALARQRKMMQNFGSANQKKGWRFWKKRG